MSIGADTEEMVVNYRYRKTLRRDKAKIAFACALCTVMLGGAFGGYLYYGSYYAAGWHTHDNKTYYIKSDTMERVKGYQIIDNTCYLFDNSGVVVKDGWHTYRGDKYYVKDGIIQRGKIEIDGQDYYFSEESGIFRTGLCTLNGGQYYYDDHGFPDTGFDDTGGYYYDDEGKRVTGWVSINNQQYYFLRDGKMAVGFVEIDGEIYYFNSDGHMMTGWGGGRRKEVLLQ